MVQECFISLGIGRHLPKIPILSGDKNANSADHRADLARRPSLFIALDCAGRRGPARTAGLEADHAAAPEGRCRTTRQRPEVGLCGDD